MTGMGGGHQDHVTVQAFHRLLLHQGFVVVGLVILVLVVWNVARAAQLRQAQLRQAEQPGTGPEPAATSQGGPEPPARRLLRISFGLLWILDGVLQAQPAMPTSLVADVVRPAAASSPAWVRDLIASGSHVWTRHPVHAAVAVVWIQVGIGIWLLVAPRGRWAALGGVASAAWGAAVWVFGEAFGGLLGSGQSFLTGAPGAALFYVVAGVLLALPDRLWASRRTGAIMLRAAGAYLITMGVLQAWPGRGFWQGHTPGGRGRLLSMLDEMSGPGQPALTASAVRSFASFDASHGWAVNLFAVVVMLATGVAFLTGRLAPIRAALGLSLAFAAADWVLVQDLGFLGGIGTDPNSMVPWGVLLVTAYLAFTRAPGPDPLPGPAEAPAARSGWRAQMVTDPAWAVQAVAAVAAVGITVLGAVPMALTALAVMTA